MKTPEPREGEWEVGVDGIARLTDIYEREGLIGIENLIATLEATIRREEQERLGKILSEIDHAVTKAPRRFHDKDLTLAEIDHFGHEFIDTCHVYIALQKARKALAAPSNLK